MQIQPLSAQDKAAVGAMQAETLALLKTLCRIPAPSHHEERRASFVRQWLEEAGAQGAYIDEAKNVIYEMKGESDRLCVVMAHTDTVFPDLEPMEVREDGDLLMCPGVGDDTANLAALLMLVRHLIQTGFRPKKSYLFVANACEEGLGNLKGSRAVMDAYGDRVDAFWSLDGTLSGVCTRAVGSARYRITARTCGGHSYAAFGNKNAIHALAELICALYRQPVPHSPSGESRTTYNVGTITGGTSVNTIAQQAEMLYEYRSDSPGCLSVMEKQLREILDAQDHENVQWDVQCVGLRPCGQEQPPQGQKSLVQSALDAIERATGERTIETSGSTDCNIPLSRGVRSVCFGVYEGGGAHTREEWIRMSSLKAGMEAALMLLYALDVLPDSKLLL